MQIASVCLHAQETEEVGGLRIFLARKCASEHKVFPDGNKQTQNFNVTT